MPKDHLMDNASNQSVAPKIASLRMNSLTRIVQDEIERMILSGELRGGSKLNENAVAEQLEVSRGPVREACRALAELGFVYQIPNRGVFVKRLDQKEAIEVYDLRAVLTGAAAYMIASTISDVDLKKLQTLANKMERTANDTNGATFYKLNAEFHDVIVDATANSRLIKMHRALVKEIQLFQKKRFEQRQALMESTREHRAIIDALKKRDSQKAFDVSFQHVANGKRRMLAALADLDETRRSPQDDAADEKRPVSAGRLRSRK
jgi:DNA-binding GntR family transcriptional regulator